jgi:hypothetical protein
MFDLATFQLAAENAKLTHARQFGPMVLERQGALLKSMPYDWYRRWQRDPYCAAAFHRKREVWR